MGGLEAVQGLRGGRIACISRKRWHLSHPLENLRISCASPVFLKFISACGFSLQVVGRQAGNRMMMNIGGFARQFCKLCILYRWIAAIVFDGPWKNLGLSQKARASAQRLFLEAHEARAGRCFASFASFASAVAPS